MAGRYLPIIATTALLTAAASVAQPQTTTGSTDGSTTTSSSAQTSTSGADTTTGTSSTATNSADRDQSNTTDTSGTGTSATSTGKDAPTTDATAGAGASTAAGGSSLQGQDALFLRQAMESDRLEIASAQAALANAERADTKTAARMLLQDHQQSSQKLQQLVSRKGWSMPAADASAESDQARMTSAGAGFDDRFMAEQIRMHRDAISMFRQQVASGSDPDLQQFAREQLPHLEHHLEMLQGSNTQK